MKHVRFVIQPKWSMYSLTKTRYTCSACQTTLNASSTIEKITRWWWVTMSCRWWWVTMSCMLLYLLALMGYIVMEFYCLACILMESDGELVAANKVKHVPIRVEWMTNLERRCCFIFNILCLLAWTSKAETIQWVIFSFKI